MMGSKLHKMDEDVYAFHCPACHCAHYVRVGAGGWTWNGSEDAPTFGPSVLTGAPIPNPPVCHSFVESGRMRYLNDCTHAYAGQMLDIPDWDEEPQPT